MDIRQLVYPQRPDRAAGEDPDLPNLRAGDRFSATVVSVDQRHDALLTFGRYKAYARMPLPVSVGQTVQMRVAAGDGGLRMVMAPPGGTADPAAGGRPLEVQSFEPVSDRLLSPKRFRALSPGTLIDGRITGIEREGRMLVDFGRFKAFSRIDIPVRQGQMLAMVVVDAETGLTLRVATGSDLAGTPGIKATDSATGLPLGQTGGGDVPLPPTAGEMARLRQALQTLSGMVAGPTANDVALPVERPVTLALTMANIDRLLTPANLDGDRRNIVERIAVFIEKSGIHFEKHLGQVLSQLQREMPSAAEETLYRHPAVRQIIETDLKPNLMVLNKFLDQFGEPALRGNDPEMHRQILAEMRDLVQRSLMHIERQQAAAADKPVEQTLVQAFSHLLHLNDGRQNARLKVFYARKGKPDGAKKPPRVSLLLDLDRLGPVRSDLWMVGKDLNITFFVASEAVKSSFDGRQVEIREALKNSFDTIAVSVVVSAKRIAEFDGEDLSSTDLRQVDISV